MVHLRKTLSKAAKKAVKTYCPESTLTSLKASSPGLLVIGPAIPGPIALAPGSAAEGFSSVKERPKKASPRTVLSLGACLSLSQ